MNHNEQRWRFTYRQLRAAEKLTAHFIGVKRV